MTRGVSINDSRCLLGAWEDMTMVHANPFDPIEHHDYVKDPRQPQPKKKSFSLTVGRAMTSNVRSCRPDDTLAAAAMAMCESDCRFLPVVDRIGHPIGVVTDGDICLLGSTENRTLREAFVREAMSGWLATCRADDDASEVVKVMRERHIRHLPVVDREGLLEGVVSLTDLVLFAEEEGSHRLRQEVAAALRAIVQKQGGRRVIRHNPFVKD